MNPAFEVVPMRADLRQALRAAMIAAPLTLAMAACSRDSAGPDAASLNETEALLIGREIATEVQDLAGSLTLRDLFGISDPGFDVGPPWRRHPRPGHGCPAFSEFPPTDEDGDGVPDALLLTFGEDNCTFSRGHATVQILGTVLITDPSTTDFGFSIEVSDLEHRITSGDRFRLRALDGVVEVLRSETALSVIDRTTARNESSDHPPFVLEKDWELSFVADEGETFDGWRHLPSGTLTVNGSTVRTRGERTHSLAIETLVPLHFDATCEAEQQFDAGVLLITKLHHERSGTIRVTFMACGEEPTIEFVPPGA